MSDVTILIKTTKEFFQLYWNPINGEPPIWSEPWDFNDTIPNNEKRGCYALIKDNEIIYIGIGIGKGAGIYEECGLGYRLKNYWKLNKDYDKKTKYKPRDKWSNITSLMTIGFDKEHYHIAAALEIYLINRLNPIKNLQHAKTKNGG